MDGYQELRTLFHISPEEAESEYRRRIASRDTMLLDIDVSGHQAFYCANTDVYKLILRSERLDKEIRVLLQRLPPIAIQYYMNASLIDEIVLTNEIEGVHSSRREIGEVLENLAKKDKRGRFHGIVEKYAALADRDEIQFLSCSDIRAVYDDLVLEEVVRQDPLHAPDGKLFRKETVSVLDASGRPIHDGVHPERRIIEDMKKALKVLNDDSVELLVRVSVFHFLFAYIHPFYDGNGRMNRFVSSYFIAHEFSPLVGFRLSYAVKQQIDQYYKGFTVCEHPMNKGDITPFIIRFSKVIVNAMESMRDSLSQKAHQLQRAEEAIGLLLEIDAMKGCFSVGSILVQAALFSDLGVKRKELADTCGMSLPTLQKRLDFFDERGFLLKRKEGRSTYYLMNVEKILGDDAGLE